MNYDSEMIMSKLDTHLTAIEAIGDVLSWAILARAKIVISTVKESLVYGDNITTVVNQCGTDTEFNWVFEFFGSGFIIKGECQYGSSVIITDNYIEFVSCGGHYVVGNTIHDKWRFICDEYESNRSWADDDSGLVGLKLASDREKRILKQLKNF